MKHVSKQLQIQDVFCPPECKACSHKIAHEQVTATEQQVISCVILMHFFSFHVSFHATFFNPWP